MRLAGVTRLLSRLALRFGVTDPEPEKQVHKLDRKRLWSKFGNIWKNSFVRTQLRRDRIG